jgi:hypothetical protein
MKHLPHMRPPSAPSLRPYAAAALKVATAATVAPVKAPHMTAWLSRCAGCPPCGSVGVFAPWNRPGDIRSPAGAAA